VRRLPETPALVRQRVLAALEVARTTPLTILVAPAGAGKSTALAQFVRAWGARWTWYRAERGDTDPAGLWRRLEGGLREVVPELPGGWHDLAAARGALASVDAAPRTVLVIDDLHELDGSDAALQIGELVPALPPWLTIVAASRSVPEMGLTGLGVSQQVVQVPGDVLRWRPWEVERLFQDLYRQPLRPEAAARLTQRTEGWVAGLQLFHLASQRLSPAGRERLIEQLHTRPGLVRDYLAENVLSTLPDPLHRFLVDTCVLGLLDTDVCDALRGRTDSRGYLEELHRRQLFVLVREDGHGYRYHEVLRAHLETHLLERDGPAEVRGRYLRAGRVLEDAGVPVEALYAYARAEAWEEVERLLGVSGPHLAACDVSQVVDRLPPALVTGDPWLRLARARALVGDGRLREAVEAYREAERTFGTEDGARTCRRERAAVETWLDPRDRPPRTLTDLLRAATRRHPLEAARIASGAPQPSPDALVIAATASLLAGAVEDARQLARRASSAPGAEVLVVAAAGVIESLAALAAGRAEPPHELLANAETFELLGSSWFARMARAIAIAGVRRPGGREELEALRVLQAGREDGWGAAILGLVTGVAATVRGGNDPEPLEDVADAFRQLGAPVLEAWARAWAALAAAWGYRTDPRPLADAARYLARAVGVPGAEAVAELAASSDPGDDPAVRARALAAGLGMQLPVRPELPGLVTIAAQPERAVRCFGGLRIVLDGQEVDLGVLRPQSRQLLAMLAASAGTPIHRDHLADALWPEEDLQVSARRIQVLVSTVRHHLETAAGSTWRPLSRRGDAYVMDAAGVFVDTVVFVRAVTDAMRARRADDRDEEVAALRAAYDCYRGELLPELGAQPWVDDQREHHRRRFVQVVESLATHHLAEGDAASCIDVCLGGLTADRYHSVLWRLLARAYRSVGDTVAAARVDRQHAGILAELGLVVADGGSAGPDGGPRRVAPRLIASS
jgi:DNA-binding SARP family transcriptional activator